MHSGHKEVPRFADALKKLYVDHPLTSPKPVLKDLDQGVERSMPTNPDDQRRELIGVSAFFIQKIWRSAEEVIAAHPPGGSELIPEANGRFQRASQIDTQKLHPMLAKTPEEVLTVMNEWMRNTLLLGMACVWDELQAADMVSPPGFDVPAFHRYDKLLKLVVPASEGAADHIQRGVFVGLRIVSSCLASLHVLFEKKEGRSITPPEARTILQNSRHTIHQIASLYVGTLSQLENRVWDKHSDREVYDASWAVLVGEGDDLRVEPAPGVHTRLNELPSVPGQRTGCPALAAKGKDGRSVIDGIFDWYMRMADEYYFPRMNEFIDNEKLRKSTIG